MRSRLLAGLFAVILSITLVGLPPAQAVGGGRDPLATTVAGACYGGSGRLSLTVQPPAPDGSYQVQVTARRLAEGSRWRVLLDEESTEEGDKEFRRVAVEGGWTVTTRFPGPAADDDDEALFQVSTFERGNRRHSCFLLNSPARPIVGLSSCNQRRRAVVLLTRELDDGSLLVRSLIFGARPESRWHLKLTATGAASRQVVEFDDRASKRGRVASRVVLEGVKDPRLQMVATSQNSGSCLIKLDPANVTTDAALKLDGLAAKARAGARAT